MANVRTWEEYVPGIDEVHPCCLQAGGSVTAHSVSNCKVIRYQLKRVGKLRNVLKFAPCSTDRECANCHIPIGTNFSHNTSYCPFPKGGYECGACCSVFHYFNDCPERADLEFPLSERWLCKTCGQAGGVEGQSHWTRDCPTKHRAHQSDGICKNCGQGHWTRDCTMEYQLDQEKKKKGVEIVIAVEQQSVFTAAVGDERGKKSSSQVYIQPLVPQPASLVPRRFPAHGYTCFSCGQPGGDQMYSHWRKNCPTHFNHGQDIRVDTRVRVRMCEWCGEKANDKHDPMFCSKRR